MGPAGQVRGPAIRGVLGVRVVGSLAAVSAGVLLVAVLWTNRPVLPPPDAPGEVVRIGVVQGQSVPGYLESAHTELTALSDPSAPAAGDFWALVSLGRYVTPGELPALLDGVAAAQAYVRVPLDGVRTPTVRVAASRLPADVMSGMLDAAITRDRERADYQHLARRLTGDGANYERARRAYETAARTAGAEADAYRTGCACVFAAVVRGTPVALQSVAGRDGVRAVDPAPEVQRLDRAEFRPPLPEQNGTVPPDPAVPTGTPGIATQMPAPIMSSPGALVTSASSSMSGRPAGPATRATEERAVVPSTSDATAAQDVPGTPSATS